MLQEFPRKNPMEPNAWSPFEAALAAWVRNPRASSIMTPRYLSVGVGDRQFGGEALSRRDLFWVIPVFAGSRESKDKFGLSGGEGQLEVACPLNLLVGAALKGPYYVVRSGTARNYADVIHVRRICDASRSVRTFQRGIGINEEENRRDWRSLREAALEGL
jgi:hypothetical protein